MKSTIESKIFTKAEMAEMERRKGGDYADAQGLFAGRIKPKINEMIEVWIPQKRELEKLMSPKKR